MNRIAGLRVLVTGAAGALGANLVHSLVAKGVNVYAMVRPSSNLWRLAGLIRKIKLVNCDLVSPEDINTAFSISSPEIVFNCAFPGGHANDHVTQQTMLSIATVSLHNLLLTSDRRAVNRFIQVGSFLEYGSSTKPHKEDDPLLPVTFRGTAKAASTLLCRQFSLQTQMRIGILRVFSIYGPWEQPNRLIPLAFRFSYDGTELPLTPPGLMHDWIFMDDVGSACLAAVENEYASGEIFNIASGIQHSNEEVIELISQITGGNLHTKPGAHPLRASDTTFCVADIHKAKQQLDWQPQVELRDGLEKCHLFWRRHGANSIEKLAGN